MNPEQIFHSAIEKPSAAERAAYLDRACNGDASLRALVEGLLRHNDAAEGYLENLFVAGTPEGPNTSVVSEKPGAIVGRYKLLQEIGQGGFGVVYMAEQAEPVRRTVALKIIKLGMDTKEVVARFEAERQALAMMEHPNIARVLDAGATETGRPYFVMELVRGVPITEYADANQLPPRERLELFVRVCGAVHHAHQKGVIHRDLKPSNILVTLHDGVPVPKVIDFGIAKATNARLTEKTLFTRFRQFVGTPAYMSPEQAEMSGLDIDTRSDIYSLGILLYELLTGTTPLDPKELLEAGYAEVQRMIREVETPRPSTRLSTLGDEDRTAVAKRRRIDANALQTVLRGDLDWIVLRSVEKDRTRRYETAMDLARDIGRYLKCEPVEARPPSSVYRLRKLVARNKLAFGATATILVILVSGFLFSTWMYLRERTARDEAVGARRQAEIEAAIKESVTGFLQDDVLAQADSWTQAESGSEPNPALTVKEAVSRAAARIGERFRGQPIVEASIRRTIGLTFLGLGDPRNALPQIERCVELLAAERGPEHDDTLEAQADLALAYHDVGRLSESIAIHKRIRDHEASRGLVRPLTVRNLGNYAGALRDSGQLTDSLAILEEASSLWQKNPDLEPRALRWIRSGMAVLYEKTGRMAEAIATGEETLRLQRERLGPDHPDVLEVSVGLAWSYLQAGRVMDSITLGEDVLVRLEKVRGPDHVMTLGCKNNLAEAYRRAGRVEEAIAMHRQDLEKQRQLVGPDNERTLISMGNLALAYESAGRTAEAIPIFEEVLRRLEASMAPDHPGMLLTMDNLGKAYREAGRLDDALRLAERAFEGSRRKYGPAHLNTLIAGSHLAGTHATAGRLKEAIDLFVEIQRLEMESLGPDHPQTRDDRNDLATVYLEARRYVEAESIWREGVDAAVKKSGAESAEAAAAMVQLGKCLLDEEKFVEAEATLRAALAIRERVMPDDPLLFNTRSLLGGALAGQRSLEEAEPYLVQGYTGMKEREARLAPAARPRLREALERLVKFYEARGDEVSAARWRKEGAAGVAETR